MIIHLTSKTYVNVRLRVFIVLLIENNQIALRRRKTRSANISYHEKKKRDHEVFQIVSGNTKKIKHTRIKV